MAASLGQGAEERGGRSVRRTVSRNSGVPVHPHQSPDLVRRRTISGETDEQASNASSPLPTAPSPPSRGIKVHPWIFKLSTPQQGEDCRGLFAGHAASRYDVVSCPVVPRRDSILTGLLSVGLPPPSTDRRDGSKRRPRRPRPWWRPSLSPRPISSLILSA